MSLREDRDTEREVARYVLYQRTAFLRLGNSRWLRKFVPYHKLVSLDARFFTAGIIKAYEQDIAGEWSTIEAHIPKDAKRSLDIGCGIGFINHFIYQRLAPTSIHLFDRDKIEPKVYYGFEAQGSAYNSLDATRRYLVARGVPTDIIHTVNVEAQPLPENATFDLVLSLISWGYHYPVSTYLDYVERSLSPSGVGIIDCRIGTGGLEELQSRFRVEVIASHDKHQRVKFMRK